MRAPMKIRTASSMLAAAALAVATLSCSSNFEAQSQITKLRVLGVQAEPAELILQLGSPLPATTLTALAIEPSGALITTVFSLCEQQGVLPAGNLACPGTASVQLPDAGPLSATLDLANPAIANLASSLAQGFDGGSADAGIAALLEQGFPILVGFTADAPADGNPDGGPPATAGYPDQHLTGFTDVTLRLANAARPINHNPSLAGINVDQQLLAADGTSVLHAGIDVALDPVPASDAKETLADGGVETLNYSFYTTGGTISSLRSTDTTATGQPSDIGITYSTPKTPGPVRFWIVIRDGRGGVGWIERDFTIAE